MALQEPYPAAPTRTAKFGFTFYRDGEFHSYLNFHAKYAAARFINAVIDSNPITWVNDATISIPKLNVTIKADTFTEMEKVIEHTDNAEEREWQQQNPYNAYVQAITGKLGSPTGRLSTNNPEMQEITPRRNSRKEKIPNTDYTALEERITRQQKAPQARKQSSPGLITAAQLADSLNIDPRHLRAALRKSDTPKPDHGWQWDRPTADALIEKLKKFLK